MAYPDTPASIDDLENNVVLQKEIFIAFNNKPKDGIERINQICKDNNLTESQRQEKLGSFLFNQRDNLNMKEVGDYITGHEPEHAEVRRHFFAAYEPSMKGAGFTPAMRDLLSKVGLPGEAQKIDRMVQSFGEAYAKQNPEVMADGNSAYTLAFSSIMLQTDAHSDHIKNKMTESQFIQNNRGMNDGKDYDQKMLKAIYKDITTTPLGMSVPQVSSTFELDSKAIGKDPVFAKVNKQLDKTTFNPEQALGVKGMTATVDQKKPALAFLRGYKSTITITDKDGNKAFLDVSKPGLFSRKSPTVTIQPGTDTPGSLMLAAQVASQFGAPIKPIAQYAYQRAELSGLVKSQKEGAVVPKVEAPHQKQGQSEGQKPEFKSKLEETLNNPRPQLSRKGERDLKQAGFEPQEGLGGDEKVAPNVELKDVIGELKQNLASKKEKELGKSTGDILGINKAGEGKKNETPEVKNTKSLGTGGF